MRGLDDNGRRGVEAEQIAEREIRIVNENLWQLDQTAALHVMFFFQLQIK